jgi:hypothetical protein
MGGQKSRLSSSSHGCLLAEDGKRAWGDNGVERWIDQMAERLSLNF